MYNIIKKIVKGKTMIKEVEGSIFEDIKPYTVIMHQCNAKGWLGAGIAKEIRLRWPEVFNKYHNYCAWFKDGHEDEIMGTFVGVNVKPDLIICNAIAQLTVGRAAQMTDYDAWEKICGNIVRQTHYVNKTTGSKWSIHVPYKIGCGLGGGDWDQMMEIFQKYFGESDVEFVIHKL